MEERPLIYQSDEDQSLQLYLSIDVIFNEYLNFVIWVQSQVRLKPNFLSEKLHSCRISNDFIIYWDSFMEPAISLMSS